MTKSNRHKKFRKQEKAKTQLTGVKKLGKAKNVVEPTLRVKKILIREQLKSGSAGISTGPQSSLSLQQSIGSVSEATTETFGYSKRKQSVQELLTSLNHHNANIKKEALIGLQEVSTTQVNAVVRSLDKVLSKIASLTSDQEATVRKENLKLAEMIISKVTESQLRPFWSMLIAHLKCTMTHLTSSVRFSALPFLALLVDHHPVLVSESSPVLLPSILGLIATSEKSKELKSSTSRLKVDITGKQNDMTSRMKVLRLLNNFLSILSNERSNSASKNPIIESSQSRFLALKYPFGYSCDLQEDMRLKQMIGGPNAPYTDRLYSSITADPFSLSFSLQKSRKSLDFWLEFIKNCIPVLIETWVESGPLSEASEGSERDKRGKTKLKTNYKIFPVLGNDTESSATSRRNGLHILNESAVEILLCIATLFADLIHGIETSENTGSRSNDEIIDNLRKSYGQSLLKHFYYLMPYVALQESQKNNMISANLKLFLIAGKLKMFDNDLKAKLRSFILATLQLPYLEEGHCQSILSIFKFVDGDKDHALCTEFLISAAKSNNHRTVCSFLTSLISPSNHVKSNSIQHFVDQLKWDEIVEVLLNQWSVNENITEQETKILLELITFVTLRRLANLNGLLIKNIGKLKDMLNNFKSQTLLDGLHRVFFYSQKVNDENDANNDTFAEHFQQLEFTSHNPFTNSC